METKMRIAVLIDGDNAEASLLEAMLSEISKFGKITIKRIYGDWTISNMNSWKEKVNEFAFRPMQKFAYSTGKNSTDTALIIDAMDIIHQKTVDGFCIISSDSDYTGIATRIREEGLYMIGIGRKETPIALVKACETFIYTEILKSPELALINGTDPNEKVFKTKVPKLPGLKIVGHIDLTKFESRITKNPIDPELIENAYKMAADDSGFALASRMKEALNKLDSSFDPRNYGFPTFRKFLEALYPPYEVVCHKDGSTLSIIKREITLK
jgi:uncharacterized protein (TIGR00288 family)